MDWILQGIAKGGLETKISIAKAMRTKGIPEDTIREIIDLEEIPDR